MIYKNFVSYLKIGKEKAPVPMKVPGPAKLAWLNIFQLKGNSTVFVLDRFVGFSERIAMNPPIENEKYKPHDDSGNSD